MSHANAPLTPLGRLRLARCVVDDGWPLRRVLTSLNRARTPGQHRDQRRPCRHGCPGLVAPTTRAELAGRIRLRLRAPAGVRAL